MENKSTPENANAEDESSVPLKIGGDEKEGYGSDMYPERRAGRHKPSLLQRAIFRGEATVDLERAKCEDRIVKVIEKSPLVKLLLSALKSSGCEVDIRRHITCEICSVKLIGGYDPELNQIVVCQNICRSRGKVQNALAHEMLHMFDRCRNKLDFQNLDHLACAEIRAANLLSCSFLTTLSLKRWGQYFTVAKTHQDCVKDKAFRSIRCVRDVTDEQAWNAIYRTFPRCYNDLEPIGRRIRRNSKDMEKAYQDRFHYSYDG